MKAFLAELIGTAILITFGNGVVANMLLTDTKGHGGGPIVITWGWGMAVFVAVFCTSELSGAHLNPAVTLGLAAGGKFTWNRVPGYVAAQFIGGFLGAILVYLFYAPHFAATTDPALKLACFSTSPTFPRYGWAFFCEVVGTFLLVLPIFLIADPKLALDLGAQAKPNVQFGLGALGALPVALLVFAIGMSLGGTTGYAINPARDLAPRLAHALLPIPGKGDSNWPYAWVPVAGPIVGALLAALAARRVTTWRA